MNTNENAIRKFYRNHSIKGLIGMLSIVAICVANTPAQAGVFAKLDSLCSMKAALLKGELGLCLGKADANVAKGRSADTRKADQKCHLKFLAGWEKTRIKAQSKAPELGDNCGGRMTDEQSRASRSSVLAAFERNLEEFGVRARDLKANSTIRSIIEEVRESTEADELFDMCAYGIAGIEDALSGTMIEDRPATCAALVDYAMLNFTTSEDRIDHIASWLSGLLPQANGSSCFAEAAACFSGCAYLETALQRSVCGMDCGLTIYGCVDDIVDLPDLQL